MKISLCMIVRDEAASLASCLSSVREAVDEIIVVDTGSSDATCEVAAAAGASVFHFAWTDDFAAARNESIARASGDWILYLDADERLTAGSAAAIRRAVSDDDFDCAFMTVHNAARPDALDEEVLSGAARMDDPVMQRRLFRRTEDLRFTGLIHEHVGPWLEAKDRRVKIIPAALIHVGYAPEIAITREKLARNLRLLQRQIAIDPTDFVTYGYLAHSHLLGGDTDRAWQAVESGWPRIPCRRAADALSVVRLASIRAELQLGRGEAGEALETLVQAEAIQGPAADFDFLRGEANAHLGRNAANPADADAFWDAAEAAYRAAIAKRVLLSSARYISSASGHRAWMGLGRVALERGQFDRALESFASAAAQAPTSEGILLGRVKALLGLRDEESLLALVEGLGQNDWLPLISALVAEHLGAIDDFGNLLEMARQRGKQTVGSAEAWEELYRAQLRLEAYRAQPRPGLGAVGSACSLMAGQEPTAPPACLHAVDRLELRLLVENLLRLGHAHLVKNLRKPQAEIALPGLREVVAGAFAAEAERLRALPAWPLASERLERVLAWPRWEDKAELRTLLLAFATLPQSAEWALCLRFDPAHDGSFNEALVTLESLAADLAEALDHLEILVVDDPISDADLPRLGKAVVAGLHLAGPADPSRDRFLRRLQRPILALESGRVPAWTQERGPARVRSPQVPAGAEVNA